MNIKTAAVIGCGKNIEGKMGWAIGHCHAVGYREIAPALDLYGVDPNEENLRAFGVRFSVPEANLFRSTDELYAALTPDLVSICTWPKLHAPMVIEAAARGVRGVTCEKPLALDVREIREMLAACEKAGTKLAVSHQRRHEAAFNRVKELLDGGAIGADLVLEARVGEDWDVLSWTSHWFDMANYWFGATPTWILAGLDHTGQRLYQHAVENSSVVFAQYPDQKQGIFVTGPEIPGGTMLHLRGSDGFITLTFGGRLRIFSTSGYREENIAPEPPAFGLLFRELIANIESGTPMRCSAENCAVATEMAYAVHESARTLRRVNLPLTTQFAPLEILQSAPKPALPAGEIVLFADEHFGSGGREGIAEAILAETGRTCRSIEAVEGLSAETLKNASLLLIYHTQAEANGPTREALMEWVHSGRPLAIIHAGLGAYRDWVEYKEWCGRYWDWAQSEHPYQSTQLVTTGDFPQLMWQEAFLPLDECFIKLANSSPTRDLVSAVTPDGSFPFAWTNASRPNIGIWVPGHRRDIWTVPAMRSGLLALLRLISHG